MITLRFRESLRFVGWEGNLPLDARARDEGLSEDGALDVREWNRILT